MDGTRTTQQFVARRSIQLSALAATHVADYFLRGSSREERRNATNSPEIPAAFPIRNGLVAMHGSKRTTVVYCTYWEIDSPPSPPNVASMRTKELSTTKTPHGFFRHYTSHALGVLLETIELDNGTMGQYDHFQVVTQIFSLLPLFFFRFFKSYWHILVIRVYWNSL